MSWNWSWRRGGILLALTLVLCLCFSVAALADNENGLTVELVEPAIRYVEEGQSTTLAVNAACTEGELTYRYIWEQRWGKRTA